MKLRSIREILSVVDSRIFSLTGGILSDKTKSPLISVRLFPYRFVIGCMMKDRRKYPRFPASHYVRFTYNGRTRTSNTLDLSMSGARIETVFPMRVGDVIQVSIVIGGSTISPLGRVVYGKEHPELRYNTGFNFERLQQQDRDYLLEYLTKLSQS